LITARTKPFDLLTDEERDIWYWYCKNAASLINPKYHHYVNRAENLFHDVITESNELFLFMELRLMSHSWCSKCLEDKVINEYKKRIVDTLKEATPNHILIDVLYSGKIYTDKEISAHEDDNTVTDEKSKFFSSGEKHLITNLLPEMLHYDNILRPKKSHAELVMLEAICVKRVLQYLRTTQFSQFLADDIKAQFQKEMANEINKKNHREEKNATQKSNKKRRLTVELNELFDGNESD
jgi:hypothetical protein